MKSNLFGKLSAEVAGVVGVALVAIGLVSTPVQAIMIKLGFNDRGSSAGTSSTGDYLKFNGGFYFDTDAKDNTSSQILDWTLIISGYQQQGVYVPPVFVPSKVTTSFYDDNTLTLKVNAKITDNQFASKHFPGINLTAKEQLFFTFLAIRKDGQPVTSQPSSTTVPYVDTLPGGYSQVLQADGTTRQWDRLTSVPEPSTYVGTILAFGALGAVKVLKRKQKNKETFTP